MKKRYDEEFDYKVKLNLFIKIGRNEALKRVKVLGSNLKEEIHGQWLSEKNGPTGEAIDAENRRKKHQNTRAIHEEK